MCVRFVRRDDCCRSSPPPPSETNTLSLHDALPIFDDDRSIGGVEKRIDLTLPVADHLFDRHRQIEAREPIGLGARKHLPQVKGSDRKSTRLNSSHQIISYAVFCLKKKENEHKDYRN